MRDFPDFSSGMQVTSFWATCSRNLRNCTTFSPALGPHLSRGSAQNCGFNPLACNIQTGLFVKLLYFFLFARA
jgi:hypothetical protein